LRPLLPVLVEVVGHSVIILSEKVLKSAGPWDRVKDWPSVSLVALSLR
jgi:hypothetical protein